MPRKQIDHPVDELLPSWGAWLRRENRSGLGYAQIAYAELVARSTSATGWSPHIDPDIARLDLLIRTRMAADAVRILRGRYEYQLPDKAIGSQLKLARAQVNVMLHRIVLPQLRIEWDRSVETMEPLSAVC